MYVPSALLFLSMPDLFDEDAATMESISSKKSTQGEADRARENARRTTASASPTYDDAYTSAGDKDKNAIPAAPAAALARVVFAQPGGPCKSIPRGGTSPSISNSFFLVCGHSTALRSAV